VTNIPWNRLDIASSSPLFLSLSIVIIIADESSRADAVKLLPKYKTSATIINKTGSSALPRAAQIGHLECAKALIRAEEGLILQKKNGKTPLYQVVLNSHVDVITYLLQQNADVNLRSNINGSPLELAIIREKYQLAEVLITAGRTVIVDNTQSLTWATEDACVFALKHRSKSPPGFIFESLGLSLQHAISSRFHKVVSTLLDSGVDVNEKGGIYCTTL
jgi:ankyrin repeat protein